MLVYDISNRRSYDAIPKWLSYIQQVIIISRHGYKAPLLFPKLITIFHKSSGTGARHLHKLNLLKLSNIILTSKIQSRG